MGHATSSDGISWTRDPNNPILSPTETAGDFDKDEVVPLGYLYKAEDHFTKFQIVYQGYQGSYWRIGYATVIHLISAL